MGKCLIYGSILLEMYLAPSNTLLIDWIAGKVRQMDDNNYSFDWQKGRTLRDLVRTKIVIKRKGTCSLWS